MKKQIKKKITRKGKSDKNRLVINKETLEVNSSQPPVDKGHAELHTVESTDDIVVAAVDATTFKTADKLGPCHELEFENGKLRSHLISWSDYLELDGKVWKIQVDPLAHKIKVIDV